MSIAESNLVGLGIIEETVWGTTPENPTIHTMRFTGESLGHQKKTVQSETIVSGRRSRDFLAEVGASAEGTIDMELHHPGPADGNLAILKLFEGLLGNTAEVLSTPTRRQIKDGIVKKYFTVEKHFTDITQYIRLTGCRVASMSLDLQAGQIVKMQWTLQGKGGEISQTAIAGLTTKAAPTTDILNATSNIGTLKEGGSTIPASIRSIKLDISNNMRTLDQVGSKYPAGIGAGFIDVRGTLEVYFADETIYSKLLNHTKTSLEFEFTDAALNKINFLFPAVYFGTGSPDAQGGNQDVIIPAAFEGIYDSVAGGSVVVTLTP